MTYKVEKMTIALWFSGGFSIKIKTLLKILGGVLCLRNLVRLVALQMLSKMTLPLHTTRFRLTRIRRGGVCSLPLHTTRFSA